MTDGKTSPNTRTHLQSRTRLPQSTRQCDECPEMGYATRAAVALARSDFLALAAGSLHRSPLAQASACTISNVSLRGPTLRLWPHASHQARRLRCCGSQDT